MAKTSISRTRLKERARKKTNPELAATIAAATRNPHWLKYARLLSAPTRKHASANLGEIDRHAKTADTIVVPGKILSMGNITKKIRVCSLSISKAAKEKLKESKSDWISVIKEIKENPRAEGLKIIQ